MSPSEKKASNEIELELSGIKGARVAPYPATVAPMLASPSNEPFTHADWISEPKMDGIRGIALIRDGQTKLISRRGLNLTSQYPVLSETLRQLCDFDVVLDGEIIALNELGQPSFQQLQQRMNLAKDIDVERAEKSVPVFYFVFDVLYLGKYSLLSVPLRERKMILKTIIPNNPQVQILQHFEKDAELAYETCIDHGFEGIVVKRLDSLYESGRRSPSWLKVKAQQTDEFVVGGFTAGQGSRGITFGALLLGQYDVAGNFIYCGSVGTGFDEKLLNQTMRKMAPLHVKQCPFKKRPDEKKQVVWTKPEIVIEAKFMDWTRDRHLRAPVFLRFRDDKAPIEVRQQLPVVPVAKIRNLTDPVEESIMEKVAYNPSESLGHLDLRIAENVIERTDQYEVSTTSHIESKKQRVKHAVKSIKGTERTKASLPNQTNEQLSARLQEQNAELLKKIEKVIDQLHCKQEGFELLVDSEKVKLTNLSRPFWMQSGESSPITKRDYLIFLARLAPYILPQMLNRPLTVIRATDGVHKKHFYQKHWSYSLPEFVDTALVEGENDTDETVEHVVCNNLAALLYFGQHSVIEFHTMPSRIELIPDLEHLEECNSKLLLNYPDYIIFDLDFHKDGRAARSPSIAQDDFKRVCEIALKLRELLNSMSLSASVKTSGRTGLHVLIPIIRNLEFDIVRNMAEMIGQFLVAQNQAILSQSPTLAKSSGKILLDHSPNARGKTVAAAYTPRATADASISTPVSWEELEALSANSYTIHNLLDRLTDTGDIWLQLHAQKRDLQAVLNAISRK